MRPMEIVNRVSRMTAICTKLLDSQVKIGLVPTLGGIHPGHIDLIRIARKMTDLAIVSIFLNRLEFLTEEEYRKYQRDLTEDAELLRNENVDYVFIPPEDEIYPASFSTFVEVQKSGSELAGLPSAVYKGMATGSLKIVNITNPSFVFYSDKNGLHGAVIQKMFRDLNVHSEVVIHPVVRESSGLAHGGRNRLLTKVQKESASAVYRSLKAAEKAIAQGETQGKKVLAEITKVLGSEPLIKLEYAVIADPDTMEPISRIQGTSIVGVGCRIGITSLNDSIIIKNPT
jgi:pantoate--beta-alanine ligase